MNKKFSNYNWMHPRGIAARRLDCWNCSTHVSSDRGFCTSNAPNSASIYICPGCNAPNCFDDLKRPIINPLIGKDVEKLPDNIQAVYDEIRKTLVAECFTASIMLMRKLIMNIAVDNGAKEGQKYFWYVNYLYDKNFIPVKTKRMLDKIRNFGNEANHEIEKKERNDAEYFLKFIEILLITSYEYADQEEKADEENYRQVAAKK